MNIQNFAKKAPKFRFSAPFLRTIGRIEALINPTDKSLFFTLASLGAIALENACACI